MPGSIVGTGVSMADLARNLAGHSGRMVVDRTGLTGAWNFDLKYIPISRRLPHADCHSPPADGASLLTALQEQLGLRFESQLAPVDGLTIVSIERPVEN